MRGGTEHHNSLPLTGPQESQGEDHLEHRHRHTVVTQIELWKVAPCHAVDRDKKRGGNPRACRPRHTAGLPVDCSRTEIICQPTEKSTAGLPIRWTLGHCWDDVITRSDFKSETILDSSSQTTRGKILDFFGKT